MFRRPPPIPPSRTGGNPRPCDWLTDGRCWRLHPPNSFPPGPLESFLSRHMYNVVCVCPGKTCSLSSRTKSVKALMLPSPALLTLSLLSHYSQHLCSPKGSVRVGSDKGGTIAEPTHRWVIRMPMSYVHIRIRKFLLLFRLFTCSHPPKNTFYLPSLDLLLCGVRCKDFLEVCEPLWVALATGQNRIVR